MLDREKQKFESKQEYLRDRQLVDNIIQKIMYEDRSALQEEQRKKELAKSYMHAAYEEKDQRKKQQKENEQMEKEKERKYF